MSRLAKKRFPISPGNLLAACPLEQAVFNETPSNTRQKLSLYTNFIYAKFTKCNCNQHILSHNNFLKLRSNVIWSADQLLFDLQSFQSQNCRYLFKLAEEETWHLRNIRYISLYIRRVSWSEVRRFVFGNRKLHRDPEKSNYQRSVNEFSKSQAQMLTFVKIVQDLAVKLLVS